MGLALALVVADRIAIKRACNGSWSRPNWFVTLPGVGLYLTARGNPDYPLIYIETFQSWVLIVGGHIVMSDKYNFWGHVSRFAKPGLTKSMK